MANRRMQLSGEGKEILDKLCDILEIDRPFAIHIALAKGIARASGPVSLDFEQKKQKWIIPEGIIKDKDYVLFKHLIINEIKKPLTDEEVQKYMAQYIEYGLQIIALELKQRTSLEDYRITVLN
jgi:hypothetical protein